MDTKHVLVLDKDLEERFMLNDSLTKIRHARVDTVYDYLYKVNYDIVVLHQEALGVSFYALIKSIRTYSPETLILVTCSNGDIESYIKLMNNGVYDYFIKPLKISLLESAVSNALLNSSSGPYLQKPYQYDPYLAAIRD